MRSLRLNTASHAAEQTPIRTLTEIRFVAKNVHNGIHPAKAPALLGLLFLLALLLRLSRVNISTHHLSVFIGPFGVNSIYPALHPATISPGNRTCVV
jgi:hypothetical protein